MINKGKFQSWGGFLKLKRESRFKSAREFCAQVVVGISYPQYSRYEAGDQLPSLEQALSIGHSLGVPPMEVMLEWNRAQLPAQERLARGELQRLLDEVRGRAVPSTSWSPKAHDHEVPLDDVIVFNRSHLRVFSSNPAYRDVFTYINSFGPDWIDPAEIAERLALAPEEARQMCRELSELGVIVFQDGKCRASKRNFYFPDDEDFFELRNINLAHNIRKIMDRLSHPDLVGRKAYRGLVTRELTEEQVGLVREGVERLLSQLVSMPETSSPRTIYSLCVVFGERFSRY